MTKKLSELEKLKTKLEQTRAQLIADKAAAEQKLNLLDGVNKGNHDEANLAGAMESKNIHVVGPDDAAHLQYSGRNTITWVDEQAVPHTYYIDSEPLFISTVTYPDGTVNYFPQGSTTTAANPEDSTLELMADGTYVVSHKDGSKSYYTYYGLLDKKVDRNGNETTFIYDVNYKLQEVIDSYGRKLVLTRDGSGRIVQTLDPAGRQFSYAYAGGMLSSVTDPVGNRTAFSYDTMGRVVEKLNPDLGVVKYAYDVAGNRVKVTDPLNRETIYSYDRLNRVTGTTNGAGHSRAFTYGPNGKVATASDERGHVTGYSYDTLGRPTARTTADGGVTAYSYDANGNLLSETDPRANVTGYTYDSLNRVISATNAAGGVTTYSYNYQGQVIEQKDALNNITGYQYDAAGRMTSTTNPLGAVKSYTYDKNHRLLTATDGLNRTTSYTYNAMGNLLSETDPSGIVNSYEYDANGNRTKFTDGNLNVYSYSYDVMNRLTGETNPALVSQSYSYDLAGQLTGKTDFSGKTTTYSYDNRGLLTSTTFADNTTKSMSYDPAGNLLSAVNENSTLTYSYDNMNRVATYSDSHIGENISYTYDLAGNRTALKWLNNQRVTNYSYNSLNLLSKITDPDNKVVNYSYDLMGREIEKVSGTADRTLTAYDAAGQITTIKSNGQSQAYLYNAAGERTHTVNDAGHVQIYKYDLSGRLNTVYYPHGAKRENDQRELEIYGVPVGVESQLFLDNVTTAAELQQINNAYSQVKGATSPVTLPIYIWKESFSYDNAGNRLTKSTDYGTINYTYNNLNRITQAGARTLEYDANGNLTKELLGGMSATYKYNAENRLVDIYSTIPGLEDQGQHDDHKGTIYKYDALGRRIERDDYSINANSGAVDWAQDKRRSFLYDGGSFDILAEYTKSGVVAENVRDRRGRVAIRKEMSGLTTVGTQYHTQDLLGSTMAVSGSNARRYSYDAFGKAYEGQLSDVQNVGFNGKNYDNKTALYDYGFRHYNALTGRWNRLDPIKDGVNWYVYCGNDPVNYVDWLGLYIDRMNSDKSLLENMNRHIKDTETYKYFEDNSILFRDDYSIVDRKIVLNKDPERWGSTHQAIPGIGQKLSLNFNLPTTFEEYTKSIITIGIAKTTEKEIALKTIHELSHAFDFSKNSDISKIDTERNAFYTMMKFTKEKGKKWKERKEWDKALNNVLSSYEPIRKAYKRFNPRKTLDKQSRWFKKLFDKGTEEYVKVSEKNFQEENLGLPNSIEKGCNK